MDPFLNWFIKKIIIKANADWVHKIDSFVIFYACAFNFICWIDFPMLALIALYISEHIITSYN